MKNYFLMIILLTSGILSAQEFSFVIDFEDSLGNQDSITLGYDENGTNDIDAAFGEVNIISVPYNSGLDVRVTDEWHNRTNLLIPPTYHTKTQIYEKRCPNTFWIHAIDIVTDNWPVIASWDNTLFTDSCREGSVFTSINPGGWWDTASPSNLYQARLLLINDVTFTSNYDGIDFNENYAYMNDDDMIIPVFWTTFGDESIILLDIPVYEQNQLTLLPNPATDILTIQLKSSQTRVSKIILNDIFGRSNEIKLENNSISIEHLASGIYFIEIHTDNGQKLVKKFIKK